MHTVGAFFRLCFSQRLVGDWEGLPCKIRGIVIHTSGRTISTCVRRRWCGVVCLSAGSSMRKSAGHRWGPLGYHPLITIHAEMFWTRSFPLSKPGPTAPVKSLSFCFGSPQAYLWVDILPATCFQWSSPRIFGIIGGVLNEDFCHWIHITVARGPRLDKHGCSVLHDQKRFLSRVRRALPVAYQVLWACPGMSRHRACDSVPAVNEDFTLPSIASRQSAR
ncbi:hypothetical protein B0H13DRAFT_980076 [Mycena leptocephala]|nr:hypothetical protein B0H13DRAFT_980076 [Mycena leptocephala]